MSHVPMIQVASATSVAHAPQKPQLYDDRYERLEAHLAAQGPSPLTALMVIAGTIVGFILLWGSNAAAATIPPQAQAGCGVAFKNVYYSAVFRSMNAATSQKERMHLIIGESASKPMIAQIYSSTGCQATCEPKHFEKDGPSVPVALQMECKSTQLGAFTTTATVLWGRGRSMHRFPTLRFGTWLNGYEHASLDVERDHYSNPRPLAVQAPASKKPAKLAQTQ